MLEVLFVLVGAMVDGLSMTLLHSRDDDRTRPESALLCGSNDDEYER